MWTEILDFPGYSVNMNGDVRNDHTGRILVQTPNQSGLMQVGMYRDKRQYKRGVALLVAKAFLEEPALEAFNTPINLDGERSNNSVYNLMWRPRWFAVMYHAQFHNGKVGFDKPIENIRTGERFKTSMEAAVKYGLLDREIMQAIVNRTYVWPTYQEFRLIEE